MNEAPQLVKVATSKDLKITRIQRTSVHDGPGFRSTIFFCGCGLNCLWCQNPESKSCTLEENYGCNYSIDEIVEIVLRDRNYYNATGGGVTLSGGEPFLQDREKLVELLEKLKKADLSIDVETALFSPWDAIDAAAPYIDCFYVDFKIIGDSEQHKKCTKQSDELIHDNFEKLLKSDANIKIRMVMIPGYNDSDRNINDAVEYMKSAGFDTIELLKYHNMYEDKANNLGITVPKLNITPEQSQLSLEKGLGLFRKAGIKAFNVDLDIEPYVRNFTPRVLQIQNDQRVAGRALCMEVDRLKTQYYKKYNGFNKSTFIHRSERLAYVLQNKKIIIYPGELIVGNFTSKRVAGQTWMEHYGVLDISFLPKIQHQTPFPFQCSVKERLYYTAHMLPFWAKHGLLFKVNKSMSDLLFMIARSSENVAGFNNNMSAVAHFKVNFDRILELGTIGLIKELEETRKAHPENNPDFYEAGIIALKGLEDFAARYAKELDNLSKKGSDIKRKEELARIAEVCRHVPKYPARTFHEAVQSMTFLHIALCFESYENAVSLGRVDQLLYPYYKRDLLNGRITYEEAKELLCLFVLKLDECILVNDGDSYLDVSKNFETLSTAQALTFGGVDRNGNDSVNDVTYMIIDACELQPLGINMTARLNKKNPDKFFERLAEIYINGCPMPEMFSDEIYIDSIMRHYETTIEHANNYSIVGCVEPTASDDHFGNTDCANMNVVLPLLQAMKGQEHDLWNFSNAEKWEKIISKFLEYTFEGKNPVSKKILDHYFKQLKKKNDKRGYNNFNPPNDMDELLERYQKQLNQLAKGVLFDHQKIEKALCKDFLTPLTSLLYKSCVESGKDTLEGGTTFNSSGIQAVGITDAADSLYALDELVFKKKRYTMAEIVVAVDSNFEGEKNQKIREDLLAVTKFGDDSSEKPSEWVSKTMEIYNKALASVPHPPRNGIYSAGYYALNVSDRYGLKTPALPSGRLYGVPLANSVIPHYGMQHGDLLSTLNACSKVNFLDYAPNGTTATFSIDASLFPGKDGIKNLAAIFRTYLTKGGMQIQPNVINKQILIDAYNNPNKYPYLMVRVAGYCAYFNELSDGLKLLIINRTCYA